MKTLMQNPSVRVVEFDHPGPSRSGHATIIVVIPSDPTKYTVAYAHHEDTDIYSALEWERIVEYYGQFIESDIGDEYQNQDAKDMMSIATIVHNAVYAT